MIYKYECLKCGLFESEKHPEDLKTCPDCGRKVGIYHRISFIHRGDDRWKNRKGTVQIPEKDW